MSAQAKTTSAEPNVRMACEAPHPRCVGHVFHFYWRLLSAAVALCALLGDLFSPVPVCLQAARDPRSGLARRYVAMERVDGTRCVAARSEERRVGKEGRSGGAP